MAHPAGWNWTETKQAKWNLRSMIGDAAAPIVRYSSVFTAMDVCYDEAPNNIGNYGLLAASCLRVDGVCENLESGSGARVCLNTTVDHVKPAFAAAQAVMQLWDDDVEVVEDAVFAFECERQPGTPTPAPCPASAHATPPQPRMHCDLKNTTHLGMQRTADAEQCRRSCCGNAQCNCWAFSSGGYNAGCWLQNSPAPLQPISNENISGGTIDRVGPPAPPGQAVEGFAPVGYAFRNRTVSSAGEITHIVVWDASVPTPANKRNPIQSCII